MNDYDDFEAQQMGRAVLHLAEAKMQLDEYMTALGPDEGTEMHERALRWMADRWATEYARHQSRNNVEGALKVLLSPDPDDREASDV